MTAVPVRSGLCHGRVIVVEIALVFSKSAIL